MSNNEELHGDFTQALSAVAAKELNAEVLQGLIAGLLTNSEVDLMTLLPTTYKARMQDRPEPSNEKSKKSELAKLNQHWFRVLLSRFGEDPTTNLLEPLGPKWYGEQRQSVCLKRKIQRKRERKLDETISTLDGPAGTLKGLIRESRCLFKIGMGSDFVAKLNDRIVVKVVGPSQINHCLALKYLAEQAPEIPVPELHGLIRLGGRSVLFMSYVPGSTLTKVWPTLDGSQKASLQNQLNDIFIRVRQIERKGRPLGLLDNTGVVDCRGIHDDFKAHQPLYTVADFEEFIFSYRPWVKKTYVQFLQTLLPASRFEEQCVFTHCDVRTDNIMVDTDYNGDWKVSGVIDWEEAGFYPAYWEAAKSTRTFLANQENDWYLTQPSCIAPSSHPTAWLVDRLWEEMIQYLRTLERNMKKGRTGWKTEDLRDR